MKNLQRDFCQSIVWLMLLVLIWQPINGVSFAQTQTSTRRLANDKLLVHVVNRLTFGARAGDIERVRAMGVEKFIDTQLHPEKIDDRRLEARLMKFPTLKMSNAELLARYPQPGQVLRRLQREGKLSPELEAMIGNRRNNNSMMTQSGNDTQNDSLSNQSSANQAGNNQRASLSNQPNSDARRTYRQQMAQFYAANNLQLPARIMQELQAARVLRALHSERQLQEVMVDFWTNHFNVFANKGADKWFLVEYDRDVIRPHALGNFRALLGATARSPAMLFYLDNFQSVTPNMTRQRSPNRNFNRRRMRRDTEAQPPNATPPNTQPVRARRGINENYARELMELHTLGVDGGYTQKDIIEVARAFTGWTIYSPRGRTTPQMQRLARFADKDLQPGEFVFNSRAHDDGEKTILGRKIAAGGGIEDGEKVLDILANHPSTARFIATKLARKFISDAPQPETIQTIAEAFLKSNGDIKQTLRRVFATDEFNRESNFRAKIKTPFEYAVSAMRALEVETENPHGVHHAIARMGEPLYGYQAPTGYPDTAEHWVNTGALLERLNFGVALSSGRLGGTHYDVRRLVNEKQPRISDDNRAPVIDDLLAKLLNNIVTDETRARLLRQLDAPETATVKSDSTLTNHALIDDATAEDVTADNRLVHTPNNSMAMSLTGDAADASAMSLPRRASRRAARQEARAARLAADFSPEEQLVRRIIGFIISLPEFQRQ